MMLIVALQTLHPDIDSGFQYVSGTYTGESVQETRRMETNR